MGPNMPAFGEGWVSYDFEVPSQETELPDGWLLLNNGDISSPPVHDWDTIIQNVDQLEFFGGDPTLVFIFQQWDMGADNVRITTETPVCDILVCHCPPGYGTNACHTIAVGEAAIPAHLAHGDTMGACTGTDIPAEAYRITEPMSGIGSDQPRDSVFGN
jgi:hypothetical protein